MHAAAATGASGSVAPWSSAGSPPAAVRLHHHRRAEGARPGEPATTSSTSGSATPTCPSPDDRGREAGRGGPQHPQPPLLVQPGHPQAARGGRRPLPAPLRRGPRPRDRGHQHHRRQGGLQPPDVGAAPARRRRPRAVAVATRSTSGARSSPAPTSARSRCRHRRRLLRRTSSEAVRVLVAQAPGDRAVVPAQPHHHLRRPRLLPAGGRLRPREGRGRRPRQRLRRPRASTATSRRRSCRPRGPRSAPSSCTR